MVFRYFRLGCGPCELLPHAKLMLCGRLHGAELFYGENAKATSRRRKVNDLSLEYTPPELQILFAILRGHIIV